MKDARKVASRVHWKVSWRGVRKVGSWAYSTAVVKGLLKAAKKDDLMVALRVARKAVWKDG